MNDLYHGNFLDVYGKIEHCVNLIIADPPFCISFKKQKSNYNRIPKKVLEYTEVAKVDYHKFTYTWIKIAYDLLEDHGSMYVFSSWNNLEDILTCLRLIGFKTINHLIWKYNFGVYTKKKFVTSHYHILYVCKNIKNVVFNRQCRHLDGDEDNGMKLNYLDRESVWNIKREFWHGKTRTSTKLPGEIVEKMILYSSNENDMVLDPFMGSGQVPFIAQKNNRKFIGIEIDKKTFEFAKKRIMENKYYVD